MPTAPPPTPAVAVPGGLHQAPPGADTPPKRHPLGPDPPGSRHPPNRPPPPEEALAPC